MKDSTVSARMDLVVYFVNVFVYLLVSWLVCL